ncbi:MAG: Mur ligase family protein [Cyanobacteriota bacterium]
MLNVTPDHLGIGDTDSLEEIARVKSVLVGAVYAQGSALLHAADGLVASMAKNVKATVAYFSMNPENPLIQKHISTGNTAAVHEEGYTLIVKRG